MPTELSDNSGNGDYFFMTFPFFALRFPLSFAFVLRFAARAVDGARRRYGSASGGILAMVLTVLLTALPSRPARAHSDSVFLDDLTWTELRDSIAAGKSTVILAVGGTEQSGPHMALGKHNVRVKILAGKIAAALGNALVAPVVNYVPEGSIIPPSGHMRYPGTLSISDAAFAGVLDGAARSLKQAGFVNIVLLGDHGGYQAQLKALAGRLNGAWRGTPARVLYIETYYRAASIDYPQVLRSKGFSDAQIGVHAGLADTALMLATEPSLVRMGQLPHDLARGRAEGVAGDPHGASVALGAAGVTLIVGKTTTAIRHAIATRE